MIPAVVDCYLCDRPMAGAGRSGEEKSGEEKSGEPPVCVVCRPPKQKFTIEIDGFPVAAFDSVKALEPQPTPIRDAIREVAHLEAIDLSAEYIAFRKYDEWVREQYEVT